MIRLIRPTRLWLKCLSMALRLYLVVVLAGCASTSPPSIEEIRQLETRTIDADYQTVFDAAINALQDLGFTIDEIDAETGIITAGRQSTDELGDLFNGEDDDGLPTWAIVVLIVTGIILVIGIIAIVAALSSDKDDDKDSKSSGSSGKKEARTGKITDTEQRAEADEDDKQSRSKRDKDETDSRSKDETEEQSRSKSDDAERKRDSDTHLTIVEVKDHDNDADIVAIAAPLFAGEDGKPYYDYRITLNLEAPADTITQIRTSVNATKFEDSEVVKSGKIYDTGFFQSFYAALARSLEMEKDIDEPEDSDVLPEP